MTTGEATGAQVKSTIGVRKIQPKRSGMGGARKLGGGMGATKVANFAELEQRANMADQVKPSVEVEKKKNLTPMEEAEAMTSVRLAYQDLSLKNQKEEERVMKMDPTKAKQMERLGMGMGMNAKRSSVSHSALSDMSTITQESAPKSSSNNSSAYKSDFGRTYNDDFFATSTSPTSAFDNFLSGGRDSPDKEERFEDAKSMGFDTLEPIDDQSAKVQGMFSASANRWNDSAPSSNTSGSRGNQRVTPGGTKWTSHDDDGEAQKKFANAKGISSEQFFGSSSSGNSGGSEMSSNRFQGSTGISSDQYFNKQPTGGSSRSEYRWSK